MSYVRDKGSINDTRHLSSTNSGVGLDSEIDMNFGMGVESDLASYSSETESNGFISSPPTSSSPSSLSSFRIIKFKVPDSTTTGAHPLSMMPHEDNIFKKEDLEVDILSDISNAPGEEDQDPDRKLGISTPAHKRPKRTTSMLNSHKSVLQIQPQISTRSKRFITPSTMVKSISLSNAKHSGSKSKQSSTKLAPLALTESSSFIKKANVTSSMVKTTNSIPQRISIANPTSGDGGDKPLILSVKSTPSIKKEKGAIRIQEMPTYISDLRAFIQEMKAIKLRPWVRIKAELFGLGSDPCSVPSTTNYIPNPSVNSGALSSYSISNHSASNHLTINYSTNSVSNHVSSSTKTCQSSSNGSKALYSSISIPIWIRSDGSRSYFKRKETVRESKLDASSIHISTTPTYPNRYQDSDSVIKLLGTLLKNIPIHPMSQDGYTCEVPRCGKKFVEKEKYRRHLHNHVRTIKHQQARGAKSFQEENEDVLSPVISNNHTEPVNLIYHSPSLSPSNDYVTPDMFNVKLYALQSDLSHH